MTMATVADTSGHDNFVGGLCVVRRLGVDVRETLSAAVP